MYARELQTTAKDHVKLLPMNWSDKGKSLFLQVTGNGVLPPEDPFMERFTWKHECEKQQDSSNSNHQHYKEDSDLFKMATSLMITHGEDIGFVPITDKYNSRGGNWTGAYFSIEGDDEEIGLEIRAMRNVMAGEQIYTDYRDYGAIGTPELLRDYGFVERMPQRWIFHEQKIAFDIDYDRLAKIGIRAIEWHEEELCASEKADEFLREQLTRLKEHAYPRIVEATRNQSIPTHELEVITKFCRDLMTALTLAIEDGGCS